MSAMSKEELDRQYSPKLWTTLLPTETVEPTHCRVLLEATAVARRSLSCELGVEFDGPGPTVDIYHTSTPHEGCPAAAVLVYIHGGYWEELRLEHSGYMALPLTKKGITIVSIGHVLAPQVPMTTIVEQCRKACVYVKKRFSQQKIFIGGHCSGAHLAACMLITDWSQYGMETYPFSGSILMSGVFDLTLIRQCYVNNSLHFTEEEVKAYSPQNWISELVLPSGFMNLVTWAEQDSPEFKRQSREFIQGLEERGLKYSSLEVEGDHFSSVEKLQREDYILTQLILKLMLGD